MKIDRTLVWIRFPCLGLEFYDESVLLAFAAAVGKPIRVDVRTLEATRGRFARVCVEINLDQPVVGQVWFRDRLFNVEYEGLHLLCKKCGIFGHTARSYMKTDGSGTGSAVQPERTGEGDSAGAAGQNKENLDINDRDSVFKDIYGDWLVVNKGKRASKSRGRSQGPMIDLKKGKKVVNGISSTNRFTVLKSNEKNKEVGSYQPLLPNTFQHWVRKKRSRLENPPLNKKVYTDTGVRTIPKETVGQDKQQESGPRKATEAAQLGNNTHGGNKPAQQQILTNTEEGIVSRRENLGFRLEHGISSAMPVQVIAPNRLRILDEPEPPDLEVDSGQDNMIQEDGVSMREEEGESDDDDIMVEETPLLRVHWSRPPPPFFGYQ